MWPNQIVAFHALLFRRHQRLLRIKLPRFRQKLIVREVLNIDSERTHYAFRQVGVMLGQPRVELLHFAPRARARAEEENGSGTLQRVCDGLEKAIWVGLLFATQEALRIMRVPEEILWLMRQDLLGDRTVQFRVEDAGLLVVDHEQAMCIVSDWLGGLHLRSL